MLEELSQYRIQSRVCVLGQTHPQNCGKSGIFAVFVAETLEEVSYKSKDQIEIG